MKSSKLWKIIWIIGIYAILAIILYLVVLYKVEWEHKDLNTYLYFYDCHGNICTSTTKQTNYYNKILCENNICPYITDIINNNLVLKTEDKAWIYNYIDDKIVNNQYRNYIYIGNDLFIVTDNNFKRGIINLSNETIVKPTYEYIADYNNGFISYKQNDLYGIDTPEEINKVAAEFEDIILINDKLYAGIKDNQYKIYFYDKTNNQNDLTYNYIYVYTDVILVSNNNKIDILTTDLNSTLLMKIDTFYKYTTEKERDSLNLSSDGEFIYFDVFTSEKEYKSYKYNILTKKLV